MPYATLQDVITDIGTRIIPNNVKFISGQSLQDILLGLSSFMEVSNLIASTITLSANGTFTIPAGKALYKLYISSASNATITIGSTTVADLYLSAASLVASTYLAINVDIVAANSTDTIIKFYGINSSTTIKVYLLKVN
jgi:hypothetical protein